MLSLHPFVPAAPCEDTKNTLRRKKTTKKQVEMFIFCHIRLFESKIIRKQKILALTS